MAAYESVLTVVSVNLLLNVDELTVIHLKC